MRTLKWLSQVWSFWFIPILILLAISLFACENEFMIFGKDLLTIYEAKTGNESPVHSAGDCRIRAMEEAIKLKDANVSFFITKDLDEPIHAIAIDNNNIVYDESKSAKDAEKEGKKVNRISYTEYSQSYIKEEIFSVRINNLNKIANTVVKKPQDNNADEAEHYVNVFLAYRNGDYFKIFTNAFKCGK